MPMFEALLSYWFQIFIRPPSNQTADVRPNWIAGPIPLERSRRLLFVWGELRPRSCSTRRIEEIEFLGFGNWGFFFLSCLAGKMDNIVDSLNNAYQEFVVAAANVLEAKETSGGQKTTATDTALESFKQKWELFRVTCDQAEEFVESVKQRIGSECLVDEATGPVVGKSGQTTTTGLPPISAVRLEQMSKAVRWLVLELQHGSGTASGSAHSHQSAPFDARFSEDSAP